MMVHVPERSARLPEVSTPSLCHELRYQRPAHVLLSIVMIAASSLSNGKPLAQRYFVCSPVVALSSISAGLLEDCIGKVALSYWSEDHVRLEGLLQAGWAWKPEGCLLGTLSLLVPTLQADGEESVKCGLGACHPGGM